MNKIQRLRAIMPMTGHSTSKNKVEAADRIINERIFNLYDYTNVSVKLEDGWKTESNSRKLRRWLHTHVFLSDFTRAYAETKDDIYFHESFKILENWFENFPIEKKDKIDPLAYHDEGTSIRLLFWFKYLSQFYSLMTDEQVNLLEEKIDETAILLNEDYFYAGLNNHGMFQDMGLIAYALFKNESYYEDTIFNKALNRILHYFQEVFTVEGVHKEHAPSYHILLVYSLKQILTVLKGAEFSDSRLEHLNQVFKKAEDYTINIVMPDFKLPNISDSSVINMSTIGRYRNLFDSEQYKYITSAGKEGTAPSPLIKSYPETGYLIARNKWDKDAIYFLFLASYHMHYHKHTDDLSFILYKNGPIFIDSGAHNYNYNNEYTRYGYSQYAHSTLVIDDRSLPRTDYKFDDVFISDYSIDNTNHTFSVKGENKRYNGSHHIRQIDGNLGEETFKIFDTVYSNKSSQFKFLYQVSGNLNIIYNGNIVSIFKKNAKIAELEVHVIKGLSPVDIYTVSNQKIPKIMGYYFPKVESASPSKTIVIETYNTLSHSEIQTTIRLRNFKITGNANFKNKNNMIRFRDISYIYEDYNNEKLAVIFNVAEAKYNYKIDDFTDLKDKGFNILYLIDNQSGSGRGFIQGKTSSTVESDVMLVLNKIMNKYKYNEEDIYMIGRAMGGFAALYYSLNSGFNNVFVSTPHFLLGDYVSRNEKLEPMLNSYENEYSEARKYYLNDYMNRLGDFSQLKNLNICIGEKDYHKEKHVDYLCQWLDDRKIPYKSQIYPNALFLDDKVRFLEFLMNYEF